MVHDFYLTAAHVVFMDLPVVFDREIAKTAAGGPAYRWDEGYCARLGVVRRDVTWDPCLGWRNWPPTAARLRHVGLQRTTSGRRGHAAGVCGV
jgi:carotenoid cleavage dioxygenase-like enzyme